MNSTISQMYSRSSCGPFVCECNESLHVYGLQPHQGWFIAVRIRKCQSKKFLGSLESQTVPGSLAESSLATAVFDGCSDCMQIITGTRFTSAKQARSWMVAIRTLVETGLVVTCSKVSTHLIKQSRSRQPLCLGPRSKSDARAGRDVAAVRAGRRPRVTAEGQNRTGRLAAPESKCGAAKVTTHSQSEEEISPATVAIPAAYHA